MTRLVYVLVFAVVLWAATCGLCVFVVGWPQEMVLKGAAISATMVALSMLINPYLPPK